MESRLTFLFERTSLHGFSHLVDQQKKGWKRRFAKVFWICFIVISLYQMVRILRATIVKTGKSTKISVDTSYRNWENAFPAVSVCLFPGRSVAPIKAYIGSEIKLMDGKTIRLAMRHYRVIKGYLFANYQEPLEGISLEICLELNKTCGIDLEILRKKLIPQSCHDIMDNVTFIGIQINCSDIFIPYETELGRCYVANSMYTNYSNENQNLENFNGLPLRYSNHDINERSLVFHYKENDFILYKLFIHTPQELPNSKILNTGLRHLGILTNIGINTVEFLNMDDVKYESINARECRYPYEKLETINLPFSLSYCLYSKRIKREQKNCNCTFPFGLSQNHLFRVCDITEFECLDNLAKNGIKSKDIEECFIPTCTSMEIFKVHDYTKNIHTLKPDRGVVKIEVINKPTLRYIRQVTFTKLDIIGKLAFLLEMCPVSFLIFHSLLFI